MGAGREGRCYIKGELTAIFPKHSAGQVARYGFSMGARTRLPHSVQEPS